MLVAVPVTAAWVLIASLRAHAVIRGGETIERWRLIHPDPRVRLGEMPNSGAAVGGVRPGHVAERNFGAVPRPVVVTTGAVSLPSKPAVVAVMPLPPAGSAPSSRAHAASATVPSAPRLSGVRVALAVPPARHDAHRSAQDVLKTLTQRVRPVLADPRRDDIVGSVSAYNNPDLPRFGASRTAIYDISAHTVYLPDGERLEAHSGLGGHFDDPRSMRVKNRGVTPPNVYELALRERPFHGVAALRLNPLDENRMFGRDGILAHSYMLGSRGESNGCVSFRDYARFLRAYRHGDVSRLVVVPHLRGSPASVVARLAASGRYAARDADVRNR